MEVGIDVAKVNEVFVPDINLRIAVKFTSVLVYVGEQ